MRSIRGAVVLFAILFVIVGLVYPLVITLIAGVAFPDQAGGSLIRDDQGSVIGSHLIGQNFSAPYYFQSRPSATTVRAFNGMASGGSNLGPTNPVLIAQVSARIMALRAAGVSGPVPADLVMSSASGLDPHLSLDAALIQVPVVARARNLSEDRVRDLVVSQ
ncbi:MAG: potassium-transporting ATPase subunit KdpC, partial [Methanobacteriota archaeon]